MKIHKDSNLCKEEFLDFIVKYEPLKVNDGL
jgi:hypothetical protein